MTRNKISAEELEVLLERVRANDPSLTEVYLENKGIGDEDVVRLAEVLRGNTHVIALWLGYNTSNGIGPEGARALAAALRHNSAIAKVGLGGNSIADEGASVLADALLFNSSVAYLDLERNNISDVGAMALVESLETNSTITELVLDHNGDITDDIESRAEELVDINEESSSPEEARGLKIDLKIHWMLGAEDEAEYEAAVSLALANMGSFPEAERRRGLFWRLLGSAERGADVASSVDTATGGTLYRYAAECGAAPVVLMNLLRAHPCLCACRDVRNKLFPFMLLATMPEAGVGDVMETLLENPSLVEGGIPDELSNRKRARAD